MTVWFVVMFFERPFVQLFEAKGAHEVLRMELSEHGGDAAAHNRLVTRST